MLKSKRIFFHTAALYSLLICCLVLPITTSLLSLFSILTLVFWLLSGKITDIPALFKSNNLVLLSLLLFLLLVIGMAYSAADIGESLSYLKKYRELLFIPVVISLLHDNSDARKKCEMSFLVGCTLLLIISYCMYFSLIPSPKYGNSTVYHITHSFFISILAFYTLHKSCDSLMPQARILWLIIFILSVINIFYIAPGRTGMLIFLCLMVLFIFQKLSLAKQLACLFLLVVAVSITYNTSENFSSRSSIAVKEIQAYEYGASRTSLGMRFDWWINSLQLMKEKPLFGHGTGSFKVVHDRFIDGTEMAETDNPHNEYLLLGVQLGGIGLFLYIFIFIVQFFYSFKLESSDKLLVQGAIVAMIIGCIMNSFLFDSHQGHFWAILTAIHFSAFPSYSLFSKN